eukprot:NODE_607_length_6164_cov_0.344930.p1 type:complete len:1036 gc:universal NODE_607_length_6164_cov_0.344930:244-3351(+)
MVNVFLPGNIVRMELTNFLTYDYVVFGCHPNLNLICGPNGSGKSSLVCAIVLGLAGKPEMLGRAKDLKLFVKAGKSDARVDITLQLQSGTTLVSRLFKNDSNTAAFFQDGVKVTKQVISDLVASLNIQLDNLCQILPQEKVGTFSQLSSKERLRETEFIVGGENLVKLHEHVVYQLNNSKEHTEELKSKRATLANLQEQNHLLENRVEFFHKSEEMKLQRDAMNLALIDVQYNEAVEQYDVTLCDCNEANEELKAALERTKKQNKEKAKLIENHDKADDLLAISTAKVSSFVSKQNRLLKNVEDYESKITDVLADIQSVQSNEENAKIEIEKLKNAIRNNQTMVERELEKQQEYQKEVDTHKAKLELVESKASKCDEALTEFDDQLSQLRTQSERYRRLKNEAELELRKLDAIRDRRLHLLRTNHPDVLTAYTYIQEHSHEFSGTVEGPVLLDMDVDSSYTMAVENLMGRGLMTFICDNDKDYEELSKEFMDIRKLKVDVRQTTSTVFKNDPDYKQCGFQILLKDVVKCSPLIKSFLCSDFDFHRIPYASQLSTELYESNRAKYVRFILNDTIHSTNRSKYGNHSLSTKTNELRPCNILADTIPTEQVNELNAIIKENNTLIQDLTEQHKAIEGSKKKESDSLRKYNDSKRELNGKIKSLKQKLKLVHNLRDRILVDREQMNTLINRPPINDDINRLNESISELYSKKGEELISQINSIDQLSTLNHNCAVALVKQQLAFNELQEFKHKYEDESNSIARLEGVLKSIKSRLATMKADVERLKRLKQSAFKDASAEVIQMMIDKEYQTESSDSLIAQSKHTQERLKAMLSDGIHLDVEQYERRQAEIAHLIEKIDKMTGDAIRNSEAFEAKKAELTNKIHVMVADITDRFRNKMLAIDCHGEIKLNKTENTENIGEWGIDILVKFRKNEKLQNLSAFRQSGGEKSVSTMLYLMSLQGSNNVPFRVVDEINQGMDPRNERLVHQLIVKNACENTHSQYFMITPKLLTNLLYHEKMQIHYIYTGDWIPTEMIDFNKYI